VTWALSNITTSAVFMLRINWKLGLIVLTILPVILWVGIHFRK
jgi:ABC-type multidrug transport system fused ATPase/permease subunit